ncbi:MAG: GDSL-type esterase/lipase family protein [Betaproteobacteria bacterium]
MKIGMPLVAALLLAVALAGCGTEREAPLPPGSAVLVIGDSITNGYGVDPAAAWPALLAERTGWRVTAVGVNGDRASGGRARLPALLDDEVPALVIIELGGNDLLQRVPAAETVADLDAMIEAARSKGARVALMAAPQPTAVGVVAGLTAAGFYRDLAQKRNVTLIGKALPAVLSDRSLLQDPVHPNAAGHRALAERARDELAAAGLLR